MDCAPFTGRQHVGMGWAAARAFHGAILEARGAIFPTRCPRRDSRRAIFRQPVSPPPRLELSSTPLEGGSTCVSIGWPSAAEFSSLSFFRGRRRRGLRAAADSSYRLGDAGVLAAGHRRQDLHRPEFVKDANILVMVFTCAHCPTAQAYQERIKKLVTDYTSKGVKLVAINPNHADSVRLDELAYSDLSDSFEEMQERAKQEKFNFVWLDDGPKQELSHAYGPGGDAARVHLRQGAQAALRRPHRRLRARVARRPSTKRARRSMRCSPARSRPSPRPASSAAR